MHKSHVRRLTAALVAASGLSIAVAGANAAGVDPASYSGSLDPGGSVTIPKTVHTPAIPPNPDILFLADTTGSMGTADSTVASNSTTIMNQVLASQPTAEFGAAEYKDVVDTFAYRLDQAITANTTDVTNAMTTDWVAGGGGDTPEAQLNALYTLATDSGTGFRTDSSRIVVWFGDSSGHDPSNGHSIADAIAALQAADITVLAIPIAAGGDGLDSTGQATAITTATNGAIFTAATPSDVADAILAGLSNLPVTVAGSPTCDSGLSVSLSPSSQTVTSGTDASFDETISVDPGATQGATLTCQVAFTLNGMDAGPDFTQSVSIHVNDVTPPTAACTPTTNPAGKNVPRAGDNPKSGQNPDGFYQVTASDNVGVASIVIADSGSSFVSSPLSSGDNLKLTQDPTGTPSQQPMSGVILWHIITNGDPILQVTDTSGNVTSVPCLVPPPPK